MVRAAALLLALGVLVYGSFVHMCKTDLRFCPGPVACQVWQ